MLGYLRRRRHERTGYQLYCTAVAAARQPWFYQDLGVPDTLDGRFDMVGLHAYLVIRRLLALPPPGPAVAQAVFDAMFSDMDINLREMGVSDLAVGRKVKVMWEAFHGRAAAYQAALDTVMDGPAPDSRSPDGPATNDRAAALAGVLARNVWRGSPPPGDAAARLARLALEQSAALDAVPPDTLLSGRISFLAPEEVAA